MERKWERGSLVGGLQGSWMILNKYCSVCWSLPHWIGILWIDAVAACWRRSLLETQLSQHYCIFCVWNLRRMFFYVIHIVLSYDQLFSYFADWSKRRHVTFTIIECWTCWQCDIANITLAIFASCDMTMSVSLTEHAVYYNSTYNHKSHCVKVTKCERHFTCK